LDAATGDRAVTIADTQRCARELRARRAHVAVIQVGRRDRVPSMFAPPQVLAWFAQVASPVSGETVRA
jgi:hypothetical protein